MLREKLYHMNLARLMKLTGKSAEESMDIWEKAVDIAEFAPDTMTIAELFKEVMA